MYDIVIATEKKYINPVELTEHIKITLLEDELLKTALEKRGCKVLRLNWDADFEWSTTKSVVLRSVWDYHTRLEQFEKWVKELSSQTKIINSSKLVQWNLNKSYLGDLARNGIPICPTVFLKKNDHRSIRKILEKEYWDHVVLKPAVSATAENTYAIRSEEIDDYEDIFNKLTQEREMLVQEFQKNILTKGEISLVLIDGKYSHSVLKKAKKGDFRVQRDFGGTVQQYNPSKNEIKLAENTIQVCEEIPVYSRVDMIWDNKDCLCISELELIEPELWLTDNRSAVDRLADAILRNI